MSVGINLASVNYWMTSEPFIDRFKTMGGWHATNSSGKDITSTLKYDANGYPLGNANVKSESLIFNVDPRDSSPNNQYVLTYTGTATVKLTNATTISSAPGKVIFSADAETNGRSSVLITLKGLSTSDPITDMHVVRTDQVGLFKAGEIFNPAFVAKVAQWDVVRFMDWQNTNSSANVSWAARTHLGDTSWAGGQTTDGVPIEAMVQLANEAHVDMWYNVPTKANNDYVTQALTYIRDHLAAGLKVHLEYSNEMWNGGFSASSYGQNKANALWGVDANHNGKIEAVDHGAYMYYGYRSAQISDIAHKVFGSNTDARVVNVLAGQSGGLPYILPGVAKAGLGTVTHLFDDYAMAPYFGGQLSAPASGTADHNTILGWVRGGAAGMDAAFKEIEFGGGLSKDASLAWIHSLIVKAKQNADAAGLNLVTYEGGPSLATTRWPSAEQAEVQAFFVKLLEDPRMGQLYTKLLNDFASQGGTTYLAYNDAQTGGTSGNWGILDDIYDKGSPRYDALLAFQSRGQSHDETGSTAGADVLHAPDAGGVIDGLAGNDSVYGGNANDTLSGGDGADTIVGGNGEDRIYGYDPAGAVGSLDSSNNLSGGAGDDYVYGDGNSDTIDGGVGNDILYGRAGNDKISAGDGNDLVRGGDGSDSINGGNGNDNLYGEKGIDTLVGGGGSDQFTFSLGHAAFSVTGPAAYHTDEVRDFAFGVDKLAIRIPVAEVLHGSAGSVQAAAAWAEQALAHHSGHPDVAAVDVGDDVYLFYDDSGKGGTLDSAIKLDGAGVGQTHISVSDFV